MRNTESLKLRFAWAASLMLALFASSGAASERSIKDQIESIKDAYQQQHHAAVQALESAKTRDDGWKLYWAKEPNPARCVEQFLALAKTDPGGSGGLDALVEAAHFAGRAWRWKNETDPRGEIVELLAQNYMTNPRLGEAFMFVADFHTPAARDLMRDAARRNPSRAVRAMAVFWLASDLDEHAKLIEAFRELPPQRQRWEDWYGSDYMASIEKADPKQLRSEAIELFSRAQNEFGDVSINDRPIREQAEHTLFRLQRLNVGQLAPEIVGADQDGQPMRLSDFRGKVVAIVFWANWCGQCMHEVPAERELVKQMQGKPFVLLGVNNDPPTQVKSIMRQNQIAWRSWADGDTDGPQPIARTWNVTAWPQIYLLDADGVIRYTELGYDNTDQELARAVRAMLPPEPRREAPR